MKIFTLTKLDLILGVVAVTLGLTAIILGTGTVSKAISASAAKREIPIYCVKTEEKKVAISFDAAWGNEQTQELLDILKSKKVTATFFLVGEWVQKYPDSVKAIAAHGHDVENHSDTHAYMTKLSQEEIKNELISCNEKIKKLTGKAPTLFRAPYGDYNNQVVCSVKELNMYCVQWDVDSLDWKDLSAEEIVKKVTSKIQAGSIVLLHNGAKNTPQALATLIDEIRAQGYELVPISQLIPKGNYTTDHEGRMHTTEQ